MSINKLKLNQYSILSDSSKTTQKLGWLLAEKISQIKNDSAKVVLLRGDLGSGKTTFSIGFLKYFGIKPKAASPTFVLMKHYKSKLKIKEIYHLDAYRLRSKKDLDTLGFEEILNNSKNIVLIEWPEKISGTKFPFKININFSYGKEIDDRFIKISC
ncbi:MAG TPA: tRNA (adenosine(37)-N6)-threonylcarbamoyltransferase complex ATPase subunit type 1 TsaE [Candidatus Paceibacterota bacterium]|nr:tRNA (adenosine(37)-N6)-threonylcarbamoyltransferase complex ATPase subunit type 1 TsaE [Candidatus Paceibacterota bacterium]